jgi:ATP-dependent Clp endopeptidase proteolytic subunit ClpP
MNWRIKNNTSQEHLHSQSSASPMYVTQESPIEGAGGISVIDNKVLFYSDIDSESCMELNRILLELDNKLQSLKVDLGDEYSPIIHLHLHTNGGDIFAAFSTINTMNSLKSTVYTYIDGFVASAGTIISCKGHKRFIGKYGHMMIHQLSGDMYGKFTEIEDSFEDYSNLMKLLKQYYKEYTKVPMKKIDEILKHDLSMSAEKCLEYGLVDQIL